MTKKISIRNAFKDFLLLKLSNSRESKKPTIKKDSKNVKDDYKVDGKVVNQLNEVSKKTYAVEKETEDERIGDVKRILKEVNEESKSRKKSEDVKGTQSENKGPEIGE